MALSCLVVGEAAICLSDDKGNIWLVFAFSFEITAEPSHDVSVNGLDVGFAIYLD